MAQGLAGKNTLEFLMNSAGYHEKPDRLELDTALECNIDQILSHSFGRDLYHTGRMYPSTLEMRRYICQSSKTAVL